MTVPAMTSQGRRITPRARAAQRPWASSTSTGRCRRHGSRPPSTLRPSSRSVAGSTVSAASIATSTAAMPPYPMLLRNACGKISRLAIAAATVRPENSTVRPAVVMVRLIAVAGASGSSAGSSASSSRNRLTMNSA